jgi:hypothetical protein
MGLNRVRDEKKMGDRSLAVSLFFRKCSKHFVSGCILRIGLRLAIAREAPRRRSSVLLPCRHGALGGDSVDFGLGNPH